MTELLFYQLERGSVEDVLPDLLARCLDRGWRAVVEVGSPERLAALDAHLWTYDEASFLPHGTAADGFAAEQPVWLTNGDDNPNNASVRFLVDGATMTSFDGYERVVAIFDGADPDALSRARLAWKVAREVGHTVTYWRQDEGGRWRKQE